jgi:hypothetical protein
MNNDVLIRVSILDFKWDDWEYYVSKVPCVGETIENEEEDIFKVVKVHHYIRAKRKASAVLNKLGIEQPKALVYVEIARS